MPSATATATLSPEVTGLRRRLSLFNTKTHKRDGPSLSELRVVHEDGTERVVKPDDAYDEEDSLSQSESSSSSGGSDGRVDELDPAAAVNHGEEDVHGAQDETPSPLRLSRPRETRRARADAKERRPRQRRGTSGRVAHDSAASSGGSWFGYDLSIVVALVSPIGNLLTGSDHVKNILLILLLIYYLHQLVEVPWTLYRMSIPRHRIRPDAVHSSAHSELRALETFYLMLTVLSPFLGSTLLRYVARAVTGKKDALTWFSTSLFVLATGVRPWSHLIERLKDRSTALNALLEEDIKKASGEFVDQESRDAEADAEMEESIEQLRAHIHDLDERMSGVAKKANEEANDVSDHLDEMIDTLEVKLRRHRVAVAKISHAQDFRIAALEAQIRHLSLVVERNGSALSQKNKSIAEAQEFMHWLLMLPWKGLTVAWTYLRGGFGYKLVPTTPTKRKFTRSRPSLESIPEADEDNSSLTSSFDATGDDSDLTLILEREHAKRGVVKNVVLATATILFSPFALALRIVMFLIGLPQATFRSLLT